MVRCRIIRHQMAEYTEENVTDGLKKVRVCSCIFRVENKGDNTTRIRKLVPYFKRQIRQHTNEETCKNGQVLFDKLSHRITMLSVAIDHQIPVQQENKQDCTKEHTRP